LPKNTKIGGGWHVVCELVNDVTIRTIGLEWVLMTGISMVFLVLLLVVK
jgi:hypothetical protein